MVSRQLIAYPESETNKTVKLNYSNW